MEPEGKDQALGTRKGGGRRKKRYSWLAPSLSPVAMTMPNLNQKSKREKEREREKIRVMTVGFSKAFRPWPACDHHPGRRHSECQTVRLGWDPRNMGRLE